ncbi:hypothetical protein ACNKHM_17075 [Shigella sonnei]
MESGTIVVASASLRKAFDINRESWASGLATASTSDRPSNCPLHGNLAQNTIY